MDILTNNIIVRGGWVMVPILLGSIIALALAIERGALLWKIRLDVKAFSDRIFSLLKRGSRDAALDACSATPHPIGRLFETGIAHWNEDPLEIENIMEHAGNDEVARLEKRMNILLIIVGVEPMLGFLGTILGLIRAFMAWEQAAESVTVEQLAAGIYQAMITTAAGLLVAIPFYIVYHLYASRINNIARELNHYGEELVSLVKENPPRKKK